VIRDPAGAGPSTSSGRSEAHRVGPVKWKFAVVLGAAIGGVVYAALRRNRSAAADAELWAEATDPVARSENH
jgi:hypothetical protein